MGSTGVGDDDLGTSDLDCGFAVDEVTVQGGASQCSKPRSFWASMW